MAIADFEDFCAVICELIGVAPPALEADPNGLVGFTVTYQDTNISFMKDERGGSAGILMAVDFGAPPSGQEPAVLRSLLDANFMMTGLGAAAFSRNPATGRISLHRSFPTAQVDVQSIYQGIATSADTVATWRKNHFLDSQLTGEQ